VDWEQKTPPLAWVSSGKCYWCGKATLDPSEWHCGKGGTLDHVYNKLDPKRNRFKEDLCVSACVDCNQRRGREYEQEWRKNNPLQENRIFNPETEKVI